MNLNPNSNIVKRVFVILTASWLLTTSVFSQDSLNLSAGSSFNKKNLPVVVIAGTVIYGASLVPLTKYVWHHNHKQVPFHFYNDFKGNLQVDKFQHSYCSYIESYIGYKTLRAFGYDKGKALLFGGTLGFFLQAPKEIIDGFYEPMGFSWGDFIANASGSALLIGQELLFNEQLIKYKFSYMRSRYADLANGYLGWTYVYGYFHDYNGHTYWLSINANKLFLRKTMPSWINLAVGYSANGVIGDFENIDSFQGVPIPETPRYRQYLFSLDVDWSKIKTNSKFMKILFQGLNFIKIPFPAIEYNSLGKFKGYWLYF